MDVSGARSGAHRAFADRLRQAGLRATQPRILVLEWLESAGGHRSGEEIAQALQAQGTALPKPSVYNVLHDLERGGMLMTADAGPGRRLYEIASVWHHHFVCRRCGAIRDVPCSEARKPCIDPALPHHSIDEAQVIYRGLCPDCMAEGDAALE